MNDLTKFLLISSWGLYQKTFYSSNCCRVVISQSVCHFLSLPPWPNTCGQDQEPTISAESSMGLYSGMIEPCPQILDQGRSDRKWQTLAYYDTATIIAIKSFVVQVPVVIMAKVQLNIKLNYLKINLFSIKMTKKN